MREPAIIDTYCRLPSPGVAAYVRGHPDGAPVEEWLEMSHEQSFATLARAGISTVVGVSYANQGLTLGPTELLPRTPDNDREALLQRRYPGRYLGVAGIDPSGTFHDPLAELERCVDELGLRLAGLEPGRAPLYADNPADPRLYPIYEQAQRLGVTVMLQTSGPKGGRNLDYANPRWIDRIADDFPTLTIVCCHGCYPFVREMIAVAQRRPNVYACPDLYVFTPARREWVYAVNRGVVSRQVVFGSAFPLSGDPARAVSRFLTLGWRPSRLDRLLYRNAITALRLDGDPRFARLADGRRRFSTLSVLRAAARLLLREPAHRLRRRPSGEPRR